MTSKPNEEVLLNVLNPTDQSTTRSRQVEIELVHSHRRWSITVQLVSNASHEDWYDIAQTETDGDITNIQIRVNLGHPFMVRFTSPDGDEIVPFTRLAAGLAIAEVTAREVGVRQAGTLRMNLNQILRSGLSGPIQLGEA